MTALVSGETTFHLIGTAHVSQRSVDEVRAVIAELHPEVVCVELDTARYEALIKDGAFRDLDVRKVVRERRMLSVLAHAALASYQRRIGARIGVKPGAELLAAIQAAQAAGTPVELVDRDINITLKRTWRNIGLWRRVTLLVSLVLGRDTAKPATGHAPAQMIEQTTEQTVEALKEPKALSEMLSEFGRVVPEIKAPLIDERDQYLASNIAAAGTGRRTVVAVVGAAHVAGIQAWFGAPIDRAALDRVPPPSLAWRAIKWLVRIALVAAVVRGWQRHDTASFVGLMLAWIVPTSIAAGGCTLLAGGSLVSAATAIAVAPIAAIHPRLATGSAVGLVEAWRRQPSVADCERIPDDLQSFRGFTRNPVTRILVIAIAAGVGTAIGFWAGVGWAAIHW